MSKHPGGRPSLYKPDYHPQKARELALKGYTDLQISQTFGIDESTLYDWKNKYSEFSKAVEEGKQPRKKEIEDTAFKVAIGYYQHEYKIDPDDPIFKNLDKDVKGRIKEIFKKFPKKYYKPDSKILALMLYSLFGDKYKEKKEVSITDPIQEKVLKMTPKERKEEIKQLILDMTSEERKEEIKRLLEE